MNDLDSQETTDYGSASETGRKYDSPTPSDEANDRSGSGESNSPANSQKYDNLPSFETADSAGGNMGAAAGKAKLKGSGNKSFLKKHGKKLAIGGAGLGLIVPIIMFFFFFMLFKNVHIRSLYFDYRMAQFNRSLNRRISDIMDEAKNAPEEAKPSGTAETAVPDEAATPEEQMKAMNAEEVAKIESGTPEDLGRVSTELSNLGQSPEGGGAEVDKDLGLDRSIEDPETTDPAKADTQVEKELSSGEEKLKGNIPDDVKSASDEAAKLQEQNKLSAPEAAKAALDSGSGSGGGGFFSSSFQAAQGFFVAITFYCIFHQIYVDLAAQLNNILLHGVANIAMTGAKTSDCQKEGKCSAAVLGAAAARSDNGKESFTQSCGYSYAIGNNGTSCTPVDTAYLVGSLPLPDGYKDSAQLIDTILNPPISNNIVSSVCDVVLKPGVQIGAAAANVAFIIATAGIGAAFEAVLGGVVTALGTIGGKAFAAHLVAQYGGGLFKYIKPVLFGNLFDMGAKAIASDNCRIKGCRKMNADEFHASVAEYRQDKLAEANRRGFWYKAFGTDNNNSALIRVALATPATPQAILTKGSTMMGTLLNPIGLFRSIKSSLIPVTSGAASADSTEDPNLYGIPTYGMPDVNKWKVLDNSKWITQHGLTQLKAKYDQCFNGNFTKVAVITRKGDGTALRPDPCDDRTEAYERYSQYRFDQSTLHLWNLRFGKSSI